MSPIRRCLLAAALCAALGACSGSDADTESQDIPVESGASDGFPADVFAAIEAVEAALGGPQEFFEVTANEQFTNVFVAVDDATAAVAYLFVDGELQPAAPPQEAQGLTFTATDVAFDPTLVLSQVGDELPESTVDGISVYGTGAGAAYVLAATSQQGGFLDIEVGPTGQIFSVDPV